MRTIPDLDGGCFDAPDLVAIPAEVDEMELTWRMINHVQYLLCYARWPGEFAQRLQRIEAYLIDRYNRDESPEESPSIDIGGEG